MNKPIQHPLLSVVIPAFNEEHCIVQTLTEVENYLSARGITHEMIVINDGSLDRTRQVVLDWSKLGRSPIRLLENVRNRGKGYAIRQGVLASRGDWILFMDADFSTPIQELEKCWPLMNGQWDVLIGSRRVPGAVFVKRQPPLRELFGVIFTRLANLLVCPGIRDFTCGFKCFHRNAALELFKSQTIEDWTFDVEILLMAKKRGYRVTQFPVRWTASEKTSVKMLKDPLFCFIRLVRIWLKLLAGAYRHHRPS